MHRWLVAMAVALLVVACAGDPYPLPSGLPHAALRGPAAVGQPTRAVVIYLNVRPGDRIELVGADAVGSLDGATVEFLLSRPVIDSTGNTLLGSEFEDMAGSVVAGASPAPEAGNTVGIAAALTAQHPGRFEITNVRLRYRLNGGIEQVGEGIDVVWTVCADDPAPAECPEQPES